MPQPSTVEFILLSKDMETEEIVGLKAETSGTVSVISTYVEPASLVHVILQVPDVAAGICPARLTGTIQVYKLLVVVPIVPVTPWKEYVSLWDMPLLVIVMARLEPIVPLPADTTVALAEYVT